MFSNPAMREMVSVLPGLSGCMIDLFAVRFVRLAYVFSPPPVCLHPCPSALRDHNVQHQLTACLLIFCVAP
jgi:hypothetical protein